MGRAPTAIGPSYGPRRTTTNRGARLRARTGLGGRECCHARGSGSAGGRTPAVDETADPDRPWIVLVWNDPINLMSYVTFVFQKLFGYSLEKATELMLDVHQKGRAVVSSGRGRRPNSTCSGCTSTGCGPRCSETTERDGTLAVPTTGRTDPSWVPAPPRRA
ncbi:MAG: ATP-dependent Clp protease adapter ClpS [Ilumatobacteraceae bacterium]